MTHHIVLPWPDRRLHPNGIRRSAGGHWAIKARAAAKIKRG